MLYQWVYQLPVKIIGFRGFWLNTISYGDIPSVVVICDL